MMRLEMKNCDMILTEKQQKYQLNHLEKLINMNILQVNKCYIFNQRQIMEPAKLTYSSLRKAFEKQAKTMELKGKN